MASPQATGQSTDSAWSAPEASTATTVGLGALLVGLLYWAWPVAKTVPAFGLRWFRRGPDILENPARRSIHAVVKDEPGIHYQAIVKKVGLGHGAVEHHLRRLVEAGQLKRVRSNGYTCYFGLDTDQRAAAAAGVLKAAGARQVLAAIRSNPGASVSDVAQETGLSPGTVSHHLRRLRAGGVVESWRDGRSVRLRASALAMMLA